MEYMSAQEAAEKWGITKRRVQLLCASNRIENATRVGNMWIIPSLAQKPCDGRLKDIKYISESHEDISDRIVRKKIKNIANNGMRALLDNGYSYEDSKIILITIFSSELLIYYVQIGSTEPADLANAENTISTITGLSVPNDSFIQEIRADIREFVLNYSLYCDDALSWCYQYANKVDSASKYCNTQFFTEKYMITAIVNSIDIKARSKILDPACGGGNFLTYCIDVLIHESDSIINSKSDAIAIINNYISKLFGYEIDPSLGLVASINLRIKCLEILVGYGYNVTCDDLLNIFPHIYSPMNDTIAGALESFNQQQTVVRAGSSKKCDIATVFDNVDVIVTNPPFRTIKGMPENLKTYLRQFYPLSKCDMCNAFIELSQKILTDGGVAGMVTQNSWMYLDSFTKFRTMLLSASQVNNIWELGSNAFYDLNGEKSNIALLVFHKSPPDSMHKVKLTSLKSLDFTALVSSLSSIDKEGANTKSVYQKDILENNGARFDMISSDRLRDLIISFPKYEDYGVPMQGTSTGDSKTLIDFFWNHQGDENWVPVSKGGGYSRWAGLNHYCVKWGKNGEFIKAQKGSAIRNANFFGQTEMVFSDTGTAGLNVRLLREGQIFVASGPGIRVKVGNPYAHLAFLNSRFASYYVRLLSPKMTIAAGYISKIPVSSALICSSYLENCAKKCVEYKKHRLSKRPYNMEFVDQRLVRDKSLEEQAYLWFIQDIEDEWNQLIQEELIDRHIYKCMALSDDDLSAMEEYIGKKLVYKSDNEPSISSDTLSLELSKLLECNCSISRTKAEKNSLGCDGILEFLSQKTKISCEAIYKYIVEQHFYPQFIKEKYEDLLLHAVIMTALKYNSNPVSMPISDLIGMISIGNDEFIKEWISDRFEQVHFEAFLKSPIFKFDPIADCFVLFKETNV